ncbi:hypothetical protein EIM50_13590 [Pseudoxanthomonas sp. SGD-10]|nr:hypothetical protein EIM50_13590 [Pseudoxanthomonas sp. SGD-10]
MPLPYENATSGNRAIEDIQKMLRAFGCTKFATGEDFESGDLFVQFEHRGRMVQLKANAKGYAAAWLREHPWSPRVRSSKAQHEARALQIGAVAVYSILRDWVKGQVTAIEIGMLSFEAAFLAHLMLPNGLSLIEHVEQQKLLPPPAGAAGEGA